MVHRSKQRFWLVHAYFLKFCIRKLLFFFPVHLNSRNPRRQRSQEVAMEDRLEKLSTGAVACEEEEELVRLMDLLNPGFKEKKEEKRDLRFCWLEYGLLNGWQDLLQILCKSATKYSLETIFFKQIYPSECRKLLEQHIDYVLYKGTLLPLVVPPIITQMVLWIIWLVVLCSFKIFLSLANDRLERLYTSPTVTPCKYLRVFSALLVVLAADLFWIRLCMVAYPSLGSSLSLLSFFEPLNIAFETLPALIVHGFHLIDIWQRHSTNNRAYCLASFDFSAGSIAKWKGLLILLDVIALLMSVGHYLLIWWLQGMAFHLVNAVLFLYLYRILSTMVKRVRSFINSENATIFLGEAFPDATNKELSAFDDQCAICRGQMTKAKKLPCNHLFHLSCLKSWLDQGWTEVYSCPTCRGLLFLSNSQIQQNPVTHFSAVAFLQPLAERDPFDT